MSYAQYPTRPPEKPEIGPSPRRNRAESSRICSTGLLPSGRSTIAESAGSPSQVIFLSRVKTRGGSRQMMDLTALRGTPSIDSSMQPVAPPIARKSVYGSARGTGMLRVTGSTRNGAGCNFSGFSPALLSEPAASPAAIPSPVASPVIVCARLSCLFMYNIDHIYTLVLILRCLMTFPYASKN
ncbi:MAG: hypothetical protein A4E40_00665 [Methanoregulaceae archaeon PtaU1.Bin059]|nr:MAG: hypothetical protein A4E40_00665 [Methanoregulaceae archaeon PtaU1.Bin059]